MTTSLSRPQAATAGTAHGWRYLLGSLATAVPIANPLDGVTVIDTALAAAEPLAAALEVDLRHGVVVLELRSDTGRVGRPEVAAAERITAALRAGERRVDPTAGRRVVQAIEIGLDTMDRAAIRPFWAAVLAYVDDPADGADPNGLIDPLGQGPSLWFQDMDAPRPQRNRLHFDVTVGEDQAESRIAAALAAGGTLLTDEHAKAFWVLADAEGNEVCVCTWQDRD